MYNIDGYKMLPLKKGLFPQKGLQANPKKYVNKCSKGKKFQIIKQVVNIIKH